MIHIVEGECGTKWQEGMRDPQDGPGESMEYADQLLRTIERTLFKPIQRDDDDNPLDTVILSLGPLSYTPPPHVPNKNDAAPAKRMFEFITAARSRSIVQKVWDNPTEDPYPENQRPLDTLLELKHLRPKMDSSTSRKLLPMTYSDLFSSVKAFKEYPLPHIVEEKLDIRDGADVYPIVDDHIKERILELEEFVRSAQDATRSVEHLPIWDKLEEMAPLRPEEETDFPLYVPVFPRNHAHNHTDPSISPTKHADLASLLGPPIDAAMEPDSVGSPKAILSAFPEVYEEQDPLSKDLLKHMDPMPRALTTSPSLEHFRLPPLPDQSLFHALIGLPAPDLPLDEEGDGDFSMPSVPPGSQFSSGLGTHFDIDTGDAQGIGRDFIPDVQLTHAAEEDLTLDSTSAKTMDTTVAFGKFEPAVKGEGSQIAAKHGEVAGSNGIYGNPPTEHRRGIKKRKKVRFGTELHEHESSHLDNFSTGHKVEVPARPTPTTEPVKTPARNGVEVPSMPSQKLSGTWPIFSPEEQIDELDDESYLAPREPVLAPLVPLDTPLSLAEVSALLAQEEEGFPPDASSSLVEVDLLLGLKREYIAPRWRTVRQYEAEFGEEVIVQVSSSDSSDPGQRALKDTRPPSKKRRLASKIGVGNSKIEARPRLLIHLPRPTDSALITQESYETVLREQIGGYSSSSFSRITPSPTTFDAPRKMYLDSVGKGPEEVKAAGSLPGATHRSAIEDPITEGNLILKQPRPIGRWHPLPTGKRSSEAGRIDPNDANHIRSERGLGENLPNLFQIIGSSSKTFPSLGKSKASLQIRQQDNISQAAKQWIDHPILRNPTWYTQAVSESRLRQSSSQRFRVSVLASTDCWGNDPLSQALLQEGFLFFEQADPIQNADLVLSPTTSVIFLRLSEITDDPLLLIDRIRGASRCSGRVIIVVEIISYSTTHIHEMETDLVTESVSLALATVREAFHDRPGLVMTSQTDSLKKNRRRGPNNDQIEWVFACRGATEVARVIRRLVEDEYAEMQKSLGMKEAKDLFEDRVWLEDNGEETNELMLVENLNINSVGALYILYKTTMKDFMEMGDRNRKRGWDSVFGAYKIERINGIITRRFSEPALAWSTP